ncbi:hypothetical protein DACRYDRAFT_23723 [Dacryopinax primogenitus]|uniref:RNase III domain-containing protein n=1 Tax=Dacryopinax primogenitus (strain DJM 731) TaxID=1858805 RepID=M5G7C6_DACPD|nr:uncharacterized protein DACRYDRAFT_23723 [Dacryopinax primogenitus]EJT99667.1 hypothetical protein DACRYDRAFT_23723 [Dacryopinax primogenitus]
MVSPVPWMTDRERYDIWRRMRNSAHLSDSFNRMAWIGDDALKTQVTQYLYQSTLDRFGADTLLMHDLRELFECRWSQLVITVALGLDEEVDPPLQPLVQGMGRSNPQIKSYADIFEAYIGGLCSKDRAVVDHWISTLVRRFYRDLMKEVERYLGSTSYPREKLDVTCIRLHVDWDPFYGPFLELKPRHACYHLQPWRTFLLPDCFILTSIGHPPRLMRHPVLSSEDVHQKRMPRDTFAASFRRTAMDARQGTVLTMTPVNRSSSAPFPPGTLSMPSMPTSSNVHLRVVHNLSSTHLEIDSSRHASQNGLKEIVDLTQDEDDDAENDNDCDCDMNEVEDLL